LKNQKNRYITCAALFTATVVVFTAFLSFPIGFNSGYIHLGDCVIYLAACILPFPYSLVCGGIGGVLADLILGATIWAPATLIIKMLNVIPFIIAYKISKKHNKILNPMTVVMSIVSGIITIVGYIYAEILLFSLPIESVWALLPIGVIQPLCNTVVFFIVGFALDKVKFKEMITKI
jgi:uncharacterized repeat protein (TIGR04002 family)